MRHARKDYDRIQDPAGLIPEDEPVFLLRGKDKAAPRAIRQWAIEAARLGASQAILYAARCQAEAMEDYQRRTGLGQVPDLPKEAADGN